MVVLTSSFSEFILVLVLDIMTKIGIIFAQITQREAGHVLSESGTVELVLSIRLVFYRESHQAERWHAIHLFFFFFCVSNKS
jgi:hypothetical protein